jgi:predicted RNA-binding protein
MCIATIYFDDGKQQEEVMRDVVQLEAEEDGFLLVSLLGEKKFLKGRLKSIDFLREHSVIIQKEGS